MTKTLNQIAEQLSTPRTITKTVTEEKLRIPAKEVIEIKPIPKVQLIYAFNGTGKTRLSRELKNLVAPKVPENGEEALQPREKILYYNAFTEDLFYWDNDLDTDRAPKLKIQPNTYTNWLMGLLKDLGQDSNIVRYFQRYANDKLTPYFNGDFTEVTFAIEAGDNQGAETLKISKGEESNFIWSIFYTLLDQVVSIKQS